MVVAMAEAVATALHSICHLWIFLSLIDVYLHVTLHCTIQSEPVLPAPSVTAPVEKESQPEWNNRWSVCVSKAGSLLFCSCNLPGSK